MHLSFVLFHWLRFLGAVFALCFAILYIMGGEEISLAGFAVIALVASVIGIRIRKGSMPATCDLCKTRGTMKAEYGAGFSNARLVITCPHCGRVVNKAKTGIKTGIE